MGNRVCFLSRAERLRLTLLSNNNWSESRVWDYLIELELTNQQPLLPHLLGLGLTLPQAQTVLINYRAVFGVAFMASWRKNRQHDTAFFP